MPERMTPILSSFLVVGKRAQEKINRKAQSSCFNWFKQVKHPL